MDREAIKQTPLSRCWACGDVHVKPDDPPEHIIPASLGGTLTTPRFADKCNKELGSRVDQPLASDFMIAITRTRFEIRDRRKRIPPSAKLRAKTPEGRPVVFDYQDMGMHSPPYIEEDEERIVITADTEEQAREIAQTKLKRLERDGAKGRINRFEWKKHGGRSEVKATLSMSSTIRARAAAKVALGALSLVLEDDWLDTDAAQLLQSWLWEDPPKGSNGGTIFAIPRKVPYPFSAFCRPPEHLMWCFPGKDGRTSFAIALFGEEFMVVDAGPLNDPSLDIAWVLDPVALSWGVSSFGELILRGREAYERDMAKAGWTPT